MIKNLFNRVFDIYSVKFKGFGKVFNISIGNKIAILLIIVIIIMGGFTAILVKQSLNYDKQFVLGNSSSTVTDSFNKLESLKDQIKNRLDSCIITKLTVIGITVLILLAAALIISWRISKPINNLKKKIESETQQNIVLGTENIKVNEVESLGLGFNIMMSNIKELKENSIKEQENLKKSELRTLQAQINPHFLYNSLDSIMWIAEANKSEKVVEIVSELSNFFRISLSKGKDWISIKDEIEQTRSYLNIQKIRYEDILDFKIDIEEELLDYRILKMILQPVVENALYHGIKNKRSGGSIYIKGSKTEDNNLMLEIVDNGIGMSPEKLKEIMAEFDNNSFEYTKVKNGFGLSNVHKRIRMYYGDKYGVSIKSEVDKGTNVTLLVKCER